MFSTNQASNAQSVPQQHQSEEEDWVAFFSFKKIRHNPNEVRNILLVIAVLMATATYQAGLSPPGGVWQDDKIGQHYAGVSIMGSKNETRFNTFMLFNSLGFYMSLYIISFLTYGFPFWWELQITSFALVATYISCLTTIAPTGDAQIQVQRISIFLPLVIPLAVMGVRRYVKKG